eukprot:scpid69173/ scgid16883/ Cyclin-dependent kinase 16; Cell division protein kinase 16; PCTAIRE-motif protein kinase 1; Serine/threonine-protein kinase PCTAIRE-1
MASWKKRLSLSINHRPSIEEHASEDRSQPQAMQDDGGSALNNEERDTVEGITSSKKGFSRSKSHKEVKSTSRSSLGVGVTLRTGLSVSPGSRARKYRSDSQLGEGATSMSESSEDGDMRGLTSASMPNSPSRGLSPALDLSRKMSKRQRRLSQTELGFGRLETYEKLEQLGEGTYATVFKAQSTLTGLTVAMKEIRLEHEEGAPCTAIREISLLKDLKHANIVTLHDIIYSKSLVLIFEYMHRDLKQYMETCKGTLHLTNIKYFAFQLLRGLAYCHSKKVLHRDLKPQNLLISDTGDLKLADFGLARAKSVPSKTYSNEVVTLWYRPPDVLLGSVNYSGTIDMWGVGCILFEMVLGRPPFPGSNVEDQLMLIFRALGTPTPTSWPGIDKNQEFLAVDYPPYLRHDLGTLVPRMEPEGIALMDALLVYRPELRPTAKEAMKHPYFDSLGERIHQLFDTVSIFTVDGIELQPDPGRPADEAQETEVVIGSDSTTVTTLT